MGSNRDRKAGGGSQDFGAGLKYNSRLEVGEGWGPRARRPQSRSARTVSCTGPSVSPELRSTARGWPERGCTGGISCSVGAWPPVAGRGRSDLGPRSALSRPPRRREAPGPRGVGGAPPASCPLASLDGWKREPPWGSPLLPIGLQCSEWVTWAMARTSWRPVCPWPLQKLVLVFLVKGALDLL